MKRGFTIMELALVLAIIALLAFMGISALTRFRSSALLDQTHAEIVTALNEARGMTLASKEGDVYGVHFDLDADPSTALLLEGSTSTPLETLYTYPDNVNILFRECNTSAEINFQGKSTVELKCNGTDTLEDSLTVTVSREDDPSKTKTMYIHKSVGVPQVVK